MPKLKVLTFIRNKNGNIALTSSDKRLLEQLRKEVNFEEITVIENNDLIESEEQKVVFVEELGISRYKKFEKQLQVAENFDKELIAVVAVK